MSPRASRESRFRARLWTLEETAEYLSIPRATLYKLNHKGTGPPFFHVGRHCRYDPDEVVAWLTSRCRVPGLA